MQEPSTNHQSGESDRANVLVMIFGLAVMLAALWAADVAFTNHHDEEARTTVQATPAQSR
jgi:hypothetical protein